jgi:ABC-2 type transport system ATP-binding protein
MIDIFAENIFKSFATIPALHDFSIRVEKGCLYGLIGPDGAGKTTLMRMLCSLIKADSGKLTIRDMDTCAQATSIRRILGYMPQRFSLYQDLTVEQNLRFFADLFQVDRKIQKERMKFLYEFSRLGPFNKRKAGALSGGMKQKLALSCNLMHSPDIMILDEPTFGVDPVSRHEFWDILHELNSNGTTLLVSTPYMEEAEQCSKITLIRKGKDISTGTPKQIIKGYPYHLYSVMAHDIHVMRGFFLKHTDIITTQLFGDSLHLGFRTKPNQSDWEDYKQQSQNNLISFEPINASMEDVFLTLKETSHEN